MFVEPKSHANPEPITVSGKMAVGMRATVIHNCIWVLVITGHKSRGWSEKGRLLRGKAALGCKQTQGPSGPAPELKTFMAELGNGKPKVVLCYQAA